MSARRQPEQQAPPVQRLRVQYAKRGRARFASHRDFSRAFERALRRAEIPMAFSSGFSPHPRISYVNAAPTGAATEAEYLELGLAEVREPEQVREALNQAMPEGLVIVKVTEAQPGSLADRLSASAWRVEIAGADPTALDRAIEALLAAETFDVQRMTKTGLRTFDVRGAIIALASTPTGFALVSAIGEPLVRPDDVLRALQQLEPALAEVGPALISREAQGAWDGSRIRDPLDR